ncbi:MAG: ATP-binding protein [Bacteroidetes bacterium]|nr:ATP-binding protein [Bacteroidota bacterium]
MAKQKGTIKNNELTAEIAWFQKIISTSINLYFQQECEIDSLYKIEPPKNGKLESLINNDTITFDEKIVIMLGLMPHLYPQILDVFFIQNKNFNRSYTEFGGWKGFSHGGFLPTGETVAFIIAGEDIEKRKYIGTMFEKEHWFYKNNILRLEGVGNGEPFLSGQLLISDETLYKVLKGKEYKPDYSVGFPAKLITTELNWEDMVLDYQVYEDINELNTWIKSSNVIMEDWGLNRFLKAGYRSLFYGPPGTGKTLAATLIGKKNNIDVYRIDLSMIVSKYIGETEKNLAKVFDMAENRNWILFFDEADSLFGKRTSTNTSNDRHANQEVAYLLQRIEDFPGTVILATNLKSNIDEAFSRRFQSVIYFSMPTEDLRAKLWLKMLPKSWLGKETNEYIKIASRYELSGGSISNVIRKCALRMLAKQTNILDKEIFKEALNKESLKK